VNNLEAEFNRIVVKTQNRRTQLGPVRERIVRDIYQQAQEIAGEVVTKHDTKSNLDRRIDNIVTSKIFGYPLMLALLSLVFWLTVSGANVKTV
jgi:ferrous iron transport protein B